ncbi:MAG TPA: Hsp20/alpha crystallin family protein [Armatimonadota bacterium]|jgi:HSP20 family protein
MFKRYEDLIRQMEREMQRFQQEAFGSMLGGGGLPGRMWQPNVDICESEDCLWVRVEAAGLSLANTRITLAADNRVLTISGERPEPGDACEGRRRCHQLEVYFGRFQRDVLLPNVPLDRDAVTANYKDGFLVVTLPKRVSAETGITAIPVLGE